MKTTSLWVLGGCLLAGAAWAEAPKKPKAAAAAPVEPVAPDPAAVIPKTGADGVNPLVDRLSRRLSPEVAPAGGVPEGFEAPAMGDAAGVVVEAVEMGLPAPTAPDTDRVVLTVALDAAAEAPVGGARLLLVDGGAVFFGPEGGMFVPVPNQRVVVAPPGGRVELEVLPLVPAAPRPAAGTKLGAGLTRDPALLAVLATVQRIEAEDVERLRRYVKPSGDGFVVDTIVRNEDTRVAEWMQWSADARGRPVGMLPRDAVRFAIFAVTAGFTIQEVADWLRTHRRMDMEPAIERAREVSRQSEFVLERAGLGYRTLSPRHAEFNFNRGVAAFEAGDLERAEKLFRTAIELQPTWWPAHFNLGVTLYRAGKYQDASGAFLIASGIEGAPAEVFYNRGATLFRLDDKLGAARQFRKALEKAPEHAEATAWLATADPEGKTAPPPPPPPKKRPAKRRGRK
ncbi:MAG: tetratricopeptide repeat protein [Myxococcales bacterium]|nr:tetratricopeptide repeat protein [Myxococcales bacterium]